MTRGIDFKTFVLNEMRTSTDMTKILEIMYYLYDIR